MRISSLAVSTVLSVTLFLGAAQEIARAQSTVVFDANAFGTEANVGNQVLSGKTAYVVLGCSTQAGVTKTNTIASVNAAPLFATGAINTVAATGTDDSEAGADVVQANLLAGLISADEIKAVSTTTDQNGTLEVSATGSQFVNLVVAGQNISGTPPPNTKIELAGLGYVVLNEQISKVGSSTAQLNVNMVHVVVNTKNLLGIPVGANIIVAHAHSSAQIAPNAALDGRAYGTSVNVASTIVSGPSALEVMPCIGTDGAIEKNSTVGVNLQGALTTGVITDTAQGTVTDSGSQGKLTSTVASANLLSSLVSADVIRADAEGATGSSGFTFSPAGSKFVNLKVAGHPEINDHVAPNTKVEIAGVGTLWLYRVRTSANDIHVTMIELIVTASNLKLPVGADVHIADAEASLDTNSSK
jgi:hypothetical protein